MENLVKQSSILEKSGVYSEDGKHRYELSLIYKGIKGKKILVISMNPASSDLMVMDTTSNYLLNNLGVMGYSEIVVWNLFSDVCVKLKPSDTTLPFLSPLLIPLSCLYYNTCRSKRHYEFN